MVRRFVYVLLASLIGAFMLTGSWACVRLGCAGDGWYLIVVIMVVGVAGILSSFIRAVPYVGAAAAAITKFAFAVVLFAFIGSSIAVAWTYLPQSVKQAAEASLARPAVGARPGEERFTVRFNAGRRVDRIILTECMDYNVYPELGGKAQGVFADDPARRAYHFPHTGDLPFHGPLYLDGEGSAEVVFHGLNKACLATKGYGRKRS